jgi:hypothetical protein
MMFMLGPGGIRQISLRGLRSQLTRVDILIFAANLQDRLVAVDAHDNTCELFEAMTGPSVWRSSGLPCSALATDRQGQTSNCFQAVPLNAPNLSLAVSSAHLHLDLPPLEQRTAYLI